MPYVSYVENAYAGMKRWSSYPEVFFKIEIHCTIYFLTSSEFSAVKIDVLYSPHSWGNVYHFSR